MLNKEKGLRRSQTLMVAGPGGVGSGCCWRCFHPLLEPVTTTGPSRDDFQGNHRLPDQETSLMLLKEEF